VVSGKKSEFLIILVSLVAATVVSAAPTISDCNKNFAPAVSPASVAHILDIHEVSQITKASNSGLAAIGKEILKPPAEFIDSLPLETKTLHPHAAVFMALTGLLCASLVKDRRLWLAVLTAPLWAGQNGLHFIPQLTSNIAKKHFRQKTPANTACLYLLEDFCRLRSDIESTQHTNPLLHLASMPARTRTLIPHIGTHDKIRQIRNKQYAITHFSSSQNPSFMSLALKAGRNTSFSPAFIFVRLARGPPNIDLRTNINLPCVKGH
jgi:hypothetical protein